MMAKWIWERSGGFSAEYTFARFKSIKINVNIWNS